MCFRKIIAENGCQLGACLSACSKLAGLWTDVCVTLCCVSVSVCVCGGGALKPFDTHIVRRRT